MHRQDLLQSWPPFVQNRIDAGLMDVHCFGIQFSACHSLYSSSGESMHNTDACASSRRDVSTTPRQSCPVRPGLSTDNLTRRFAHDERRGSCVYFRALMRMPCRFCRSCTPLVYTHGLQTPRSQPSLPVPPTKLTCSSRCIAWSVPCCPRPVLSLILQREEVLVQAR